MRDLTISIAVRIKLIAFSGFQKNSKFFLKNHFLSRRNQIFNVLRRPTISVASHNKFLSLAISTKSFFFRKTHIFYLLLPNFERFVRFYFFSRVLPQVCYVHQFFEKKSFFFRKPTIIFHQKTENLNVLKIFILSMPLWSKFATFSDFKTIRKFLENTSFFSTKNPNLWTFKGNLLHRLLFTAKLLPLAVSKKLMLFL